MGEACIGPVLGSFAHHVRPSITLAGVRHGTLSDKIAHNPRDAWMRRIPDARERSNASSYSFIAASGPKMRNNAPYTYVRFSES